MLAHIHLGNYLADLSLQDSRAFLDFIQTLRSGEQKRRQPSGRHPRVAGRPKQPGSVAALARVLHRDGGPFCRRRPQAAGQMGRPGYERALKHQRPPDGNLGARPRPCTMCWAKSAARPTASKNVAVIGINTFGWTFRNRSLPVPSEPPYVRLSAPSGEVWEWNPPPGREHGPGTGA